MLEPGREQDSAATSASDPAATPAAKVPASAADVRSGRVINVPVSAAGGVAGYVEISAGPNFIAEMLPFTRRAFALAAGGAALLAILLGLVVSRGLTAPLAQLSGAAASMSAGDLSARAPVRRADEIGRLADQFNRMAEKLQASFAALAEERDTLRRFIADASHELRTPVTALKTFNELLQGPAAGDEAARTEFLEESRTQLERLEWITNNLLDLSRLDAGLVALDLAPHDAGALLEAAAAPFRPLAQDQGVELVLDMPGNLRAYGSRRSSQVESSSQPQC